eukprot:gene866-9115_t
MSSVRLKEESKSTKQIIQLYTKDITGYIIGYSAIPFAFLGVPGTIVSLFAMYYIFDLTKPFFVPWCLLPVFLLFTSFFGGYAAVRKSTIATIFYNIGLIFIVIAMLGCLFSIFHHIMKNLTVIPIQKHPDFWWILTLFIVGFIFAIDESSLGNSVIVLISQFDWFNTLYDTVNHKTMNKIETNLQLLVDMKCNGCVKKIQNELEKHKEIISFKIDLPENFVFITSTLTNGEVIKIIESTGRTAKVHGLNITSQFETPKEGAVGVFLSDEIECIVRFIQINEENILIDTTIIRLKEKCESNDYQFKIHEFGDISQGSQSCGKPIINLQEFNFEGELKTFQNVSNFKVYSIIGRSLILYFQNTPLSCSVIARSPGVLQNIKKVCPCDPNKEDEE